jgi:hypothetical protein
MTKAELVKKLQDAGGPEDAEVLVVINSKNETLLYGTELLEVLTSARPHSPQTWVSLNLS